MSNFKLDIYSPNGVVTKGLECTELLVPTTLGEINVLPGHTHVLSQVSSGILEAKQQAGSSRHFHMTAGLCKVLGDTVTILSTTSEDAEQIDLERARAAKAKAQSRLKEADKLTDELRIKYERKLERASMRIKLKEFNKN
jgi:F-type H+-transporting ATPase subunit epsilon